jgi:carbonic anhydrase
LVGFAASCLALNVYADSGAHWGYEGEHGPEHWGHMKSEFAACASGKEQSPVDISDVAGGDLVKIDFNYKATPARVVNNGHTIQVNYGGENTIKIGSQTYQLLQFHFHSPSENTINKKAYDMELHLVHKSDKGELAVIGVMMQGGDANKALDTIWTNIPRDINTEMALSAAINPAELLPTTKAFYHFKGSLTTPPCSEGVNWFVMKSPITVSAEQIKAFVATVGHNARPVQALNKRSVVASE